MRRSFILAMVIGLMMLLLSGCSSVDTEKVRNYADSMTENFLQGIEANDYQQYSSDFSEKMKGAVDEAAFTDLRELLKNNLGDFVSVDFMKAQESKGYIKTFYKAKYTEEPKDVLVTIVFNDDMENPKIEGTFFDSPKLRKAVK